MNPQRLAVLLLLGLAGCGAGENEPLAYTPDPVPPGLRERAEAGDAAAQFELAEHYLVAEPDDPERMLGWLRESARRGYLLAQTSLGVLYLNGDGVPLDRVEAYAWFTLAADQGESSTLEAEAALSVELSDEEPARAKERATWYAALRRTDTAVKQRYREVVAARN